jgi:hypothetical protein
MQDARTAEDEEAPLRERGSPWSVQSNEHLGMQDARTAEDEEAPLRTHGSPWSVQDMVTRTCS